MITNRTTLICATVALGSNAVSINSQISAEAEFFGSVGNFFENVGGGIAGVGSDIGNGIAGGVTDIGNGIGDGFTDIGNFWSGFGNDIGGGFQGAFNTITNHFENIANQTWAITSGVGEWVADGSNWEALGTTWLGATFTGFSGDWEGGWDIFTNSNNYSGDYHQRQAQMREEQRRREEALAEIRRQCAAFRPQITQPTQGSRFTITQTLNYQMFMNQVPPQAIYGALGDLTDQSRTRVDPQSCEAVDCMHPCYGENQLGACGKCAKHLIENQGQRHEICDLCVVNA